MLFSDIIIGGDKTPVVENIRKHVKNGLKHITDAMQIRLDFSLTHAVQ